MKKLTVLPEDDKIIVEKDDGTTKEYSFSSSEGFEAITRMWLRVSWDTKYVYSFTWMGRPIIQLPEDMVRIQEVIYRVKPDLIIETGIALGGSLIFYASLCRGMNSGRVIGIDVEIRPHNRKAIESHSLFDLITLIEGNSVAPEIVGQVSKLISSGDKILIILDSNHTKQHVLNELNAYSKFVSVNSYVIVCDGVMESFAGAPRSEPDWSWNNPKAALEEFVKNNNTFIIEEPEFPFNEGIVNSRVTYSPNAFLKRIRKYIT